MRSKKLMRGMYCYLMQNGCFCPACISDLFPACCCTA